jgi:hypothetical protein
MRICSESNGDLGKNLEQLPELLNDRGAHQLQPFEWQPRQQLGRIDLRLQHCEPQASLVAIDNI